MSSNPTHEFPSPIGGAPLPVDFAPSILFSVLHGLLIPVFVWRMSHAQARQYVLFGALGFTLERTVYYALRAHAARNEGARNSQSLETYLQTTLTGGFISIGMDLMQLTRALLVNATKGPDVLASEAKDNKNNKPDCGSDVSLPMHRSAAVKDYPEARRHIRTIGGVALLLFWVTIIMGIVAGVDYQSALRSGEHTELVRQLWYISTALGLFLLVALAGGAVWACSAIPRVPRSSTVWIVLVAALASTVAIYRLVVMRFTTTSLVSDAPGSLNSRESKITFYVFHSAPEYLAAAILILLNARRVFNTGLWGDRRYRDPEPKA